MPTELCAELTDALGLLSLLVTRHTVRRYGPLCVYYSVCGRFEVLTSFLCIIENLSHGEILFNID